MDPNESNDEALLHPRVIMITGTIDEEKVRGVAHELMALSVMSSAPIEVRITSGGGSLTCGFAIYDMLKLSGVPIVTTAYGCAASGAAIIYLAGGERLIAPNASVCIHLSRVRSKAEEMTFPEARRLAADLSRSDAHMIALIARRSGQAVKKIREWCMDDTTFSARQAVKYGFAHRIIRPGRRGR